MICRSDLEASSILPSSSRVSGFRSIPSDNPSATLLAAWTDTSTFLWLLTEEILSEYLEVLERLGVRSARTIVALIREQGRFVRVAKRMADLPDRDDAPFCECAGSANADFIVTLNPDDFSQDKTEGEGHRTIGSAPARTEAATPPQAACNPQEVRTFVTILNIFRCRQTGRWRSGPSRESNDDECPNDGNVRTDHVGCSRLLTFGNALTIRANDTRS